MIERHQSLTEHVVALGGYLRQRNYLIGPGEITNALKGLAFINIGHFPDFILLLKTCFSTSRDEWSAFDKLYAEFWKEYRLGTNSKVVDRPAIGANKPTQSEHRRFQLEDIKQWLYHSSEDDLLQTPFHSTFESSEAHQFSDVNSDDSDELNRLIRMLLQRLAGRRSRKKIQSQHKGTLDMKNLVRNRFKNGDELAKLLYLHKKKERSKLVFLCDVSRSMDLYSRFLEALIRQIPVVFQDVSISLFNTSLHTLSHSDIRDHQWTKMAGLWTGGTRIGSCFDDWLEDVPDWFDRSTTILIFSDGWDTGDLEVLKTSMLRMEQMSKRMIWVNPTLKTAESREVSGMATAIPYIDVLAPVYNLTTLKDLILML